MNLNVYLAFVAGLASFLSPCVLPLVPAYLAYLGGQVRRPVEATVAAPAGATSSAPWLDLVTGNASIGRQDRPSESGRAQGEVFCLEIDMGWLKLNSGRHA